MKAEEALKSTHVPPLDDIAIRDGHHGTLKTRILKAMEAYKDEETASLQEQLSLLKIELKHRNTLLSSCEKSLKERDKELDELKAKHRETFTYEQTEKFVRDTVTETMKAVMDWIEKETDIKDKDSGMVLVNAELDLKPKPKRLICYVWGRLKEQGIVFSNPDIDCTDKRK